MLTPKKFERAFYFYFCKMLIVKMEKFKQYNLQKGEGKAKLPQIPPLPLGDHSSRLLPVNRHNMCDFNNFYNFGFLLLMLFTHLSRTKKSSFEIVSPLSF